MRNLLNFLLFQIGWFAAVGGAARGSMWMGPVVMGAVVVIHLSMVKDRVRELCYLLAVGLAGTLIDSALAGLGVTCYPTSGEAWPYAIVPPWITVLWIGFATLPRLSLAWLAPWPRWAVLLGAIGGPLSYLGGVRIGAVGVGPEPLFTWVGISLQYAVATPLLLLHAPPRTSGGGEGVHPRPGRTLAPGSSVPVTRSSRD